jgi:hypothetical protein
VVESGSMQRAERRKHRISGLSVSLNGYNPPMGDKAQSTKAICTAHTQDGARDHTQMNSGATTTERR